MSTVIPVSEAKDMACVALMRAGTGEAQARSVASALVAAEASGQAGHGLRRLVSYAAQVRSGKVDGRAEPSAELARPGLLAVDAGQGFAFPAFDLALERLPGIARDCGVACAGIRRSHHAGMLGWTVERFAERGVAALMLANSPGAMAPWGGRRALLGTNPIAFAAPLAGSEPLVIDLSLSAVARGKVMAAKQRGETLPEGWALDRDGAPTTDPEAAMAGTMAPAGGAKGAALALMVELMAAGLTGANFAYQASSLFDDRGPPPELGQWILAMDPGAFGGMDAMTRFTELIAKVEAEDGARVPGRRSQENRQTAWKTGLTLDEDLLESIRAL